MMNVEKIIEINDIYDVLNSVNAVVMNYKSPKSIGSSKYEKAQEITNKVKYAWNSYMEAVVLESILAKINFKDYLSYLDYLDKMKERCQDPSYANWKEYVNNMLMENGYIKGESR